MPDEQALEVPEAEYREIPAINWSNLKHMGTSPLHYKYFRDNPVPDKPAWVLGRAVHTAVLEPDLFEDQYAILPEVWPDEGWKNDGKKVVRSGKRWDEFEAGNHDREIITFGDADKALAMAASVRAHPIARPYLDEPGHRERVLRWTDPKTGLDCKGRADGIGCRLLELKTGRDVDPWRFPKAVATYQYHGQLAYYLDGAWLDAASYEPTQVPIVIAVESSPPYDVAVYGVTEETLSAGRDLYRRLLDRLAECMESDEWPGLCGCEQELVLPPWAMQDSPIEELTIGGETAFEEE